MQRWENGPDYVYLESPDDREQLASYLKDREGEGVKSVHFYFPNDLDTGQATNALAATSVPHSAALRQRGGWGHLPFLGPNASGDPSFQPMRIPFLAVKFAGAGSCLPPRGRWYPRLKHPERLD
jgi:hypothetical protein